MFFILLFGCSSSHKYLIYSVVNLFFRFKWSGSQYSCSFHDLRVHWFPSRNTQRGNLVAIAILIQCGCCCLFLLCWEELITLTDENLLLRGAFVVCCDVAQPNIATSYCSLFWCCTDIVGVFPVNVFWWGLPSSKSCDLVGLSAASLCPPCWLELLP